MKDLKLAKEAADTIRILSAEAVQKAKSGHPGMPMGCADFALVLWYKYLRHNPKNPNWLGRDRFVLSAGHGSMLLYSLLHLFEYGLSMDDLKSFRQWGSRTPGHPEVGHTAGVEVTTGPLGSGFASAVGMAVSSKYFAAKTGLDKTNLVNTKIYVISGDGCMMEGVTHEAASFAGHQKLDNLICFYDDNSITIEGSTSLAFTENVSQRFDAYKWRVLQLDNANDIEKVDKVLAEAQNSDGRPTLIVGKTKIGYGAPHKGGTSHCHGEPLGDDELAATKLALGLSAEPFFVAPEVCEMFAARVKDLVSESAKWDREFQKFIDTNRDSASLISKMLHKDLPGDLLQQLLAVTPKDKPVATRVSGGTVLQAAVKIVPALYGGSADLSPSTKTDSKGAPSFSPENRAGSNFHFGVREMGMGFIGNGMSLHGTAIPYTSTFFVFSDYMKPAIRLASLQKLHHIFIFTHDSFFVGEDGPTHQPIEQLAMLRSIPHMTVIRPAEAVEMAHAWAEALKMTGPVALILTRQDLRPFSPAMAEMVNLHRGAYILSDDPDFELILIGTGSEVNLALDAADLLRKEGRRIRVVSMPSQELFLRQDKAYRDSVIPPSCRKRVSIEAGSTFGWRSFVGDDGICIGLDHFGSSAPYKILMEKFGFTPESIATSVKAAFRL